MGTARVPAAGRAVPRADRGHRLRAAGHARRASGARSCSSKSGRARGRERLRPRGGGRGQPGARGDAARTSSRSPTARGAASAMIPSSGWRLSRRSTATSTPSSASTSPTSTPRSRRICRSRRGAAGPDQAARVPGVRHASARRATRSARRWSRPRAPAPPTTCTAGSSSPDDRSCLRRRRRASTWTAGCAPLPLRDSPTIVMGHGGGGAMSGGADRAPVPAGVRRRGRRRAGRLRGAGRRRPAAGVLHRLVRGAAAVLPRRQHRRPGGQRHGQRPGHVGRHADGALDGLHPGGGHGADRDRPRRAGLGAAAVARPAYAWSPATPRSSTRGTATASSSTPPASACSRTGVDIRPAARVRRRRRDRQRRHRGPRGRGDELPGGAGVRHARSRATPRR